jgi:hypothetical protein
MRYMRGLAVADKPVLESRNRRSSQSLQWSPSEAPDHEPLSAFRALWQEGKEHANMKADR